MGGAEGGLTGTGTVEIKVLDINDNLPTLEKSEVKKPKTNGTVFTHEATHTYIHTHHLSR